MTAPILLSPRSDNHAVAPVIKPQLKVVRGGRQIRFAAVATALLVVGLIFSLGIQIQLAIDAYKLAEVRDLVAQSAEEQESLQQELDTISSAQSLCESARSLGMLPTESVGFIRLSDGSVVAAGESHAQLKPNTGVCVPDTSSSNASQVRASH